MSERKRFEELSQRLEMHRLMNKKKPSVTRVEKERRLRKWLNEELRNESISDKVTVSLIRIKEKKPKLKIK